MKRLLLLAALLLAGVAHSQTQVWSCLTNCSATSNTYNDGAWRAPSPAPAYVATTSGTQTNCATNWWNTPGAIRWRRPADLNPAWCVSRRVGTAESFAAASTFGWPGTTPPPPVNCVMSQWSACSLSTGQETRSVVTPASNGGTACPVDVSRPCQSPPPGPQVLLGMSANPILVGETSLATWSSTNADTCQLNDVDGSAVSVNLNGTRSFGPYSAAGTRYFQILCRSFFGEFGAGFNLIVLNPPNRSPGKLPHFADFKIPEGAPPGTLAHAQWKLVQTPGTGWHIMVTYFWADEATGVITHETWVTTYAETLRRAQLEQNGGSYDEAEVRAQCEATCVTIPPGPLRTEMDAFAAQFTVEQLGVID